VDLLVRFREGASIFDQVGLWQDLQVLLGYEVSLVTDGIPDSAFLRRIEQEAVSL
jgi:predicted nucleotidyltransferase